MKTLAVIRITLAPSEADRIQGELECLDITPVLWQEEQCPARIEVYPPSPQEADDLAATLRQQVAEWLPAEDFDVSVDSLPDADWLEFWRHSFHAERVTPRILVKPTWEEAGPDAPECIIEVDPGLTFGSGHHPTTRQCLRWLDALSATHRGRAVLDLGCGSGILSIAAAKLGYAPVVALDHDPLAVEKTLEHAESNGVGGRIHAFAADVTALDRNVSGDIVIANILACVLLEGAVPIAGTVSHAPDAVLFLCGITPEQVPAVTEAFAAEGFLVVETVDEGEWTHLRMARTLPLEGCHPTRPAQRP